MDHFGALEQQKDGQHLCGMIHRSVELLHVDGIVDEVDYSDIATRACSLLHVLQLRHDKNEGCQGDPSELAVGLPPEGRLSVRQA